MGNFSKSVHQAFFRQGIDPARFIETSKNVLSFSLPLPGGATFWSTQVPRNEWWQLQKGQTIVLCRKGKKEQLGFRVFDNQHNHAIRPHFMLQSLKDEDVMFVGFAEIDTLLRFEVRGVKNPSLPLQSLFDALPPLN